MLFRSMVARIAERDHIPSGFFALPPRLLLYGFVELTKMCIRDRLCGAISMQSQVRPSISPMRKEQENASFKARERIGSVSYTHLDVYKRQV